MCSPVHMCEFVCVYVWVYVCVRVCVRVCVCVTERVSLSLTTRDLSKVGGKNRTEDHFSFDRKSSQSFSIKIKVSF